MCICIFMFIFTFMCTWPAKFREPFREIFISHFAKVLNFRETKFTKISQNFGKVSLQNCTEMKFVYFLKLNSYRNLSFNSIFHYLNTGCAVKEIFWDSPFKGTVSQDFWLLFFIKQLFNSRYCLERISNFWIFKGLFVAQSECSVAQSGCSVAQSGCSVAQWLARWTVDVQSQVRFSPSDCWFQSWVRFSPSHPSPRAAREQELPLSKVGPSPGWQPGWILYYKICIKSGEKKYEGNKFIPRCIHVFTTGEST